jgi:vacuolar-type H+-ATPase subunit F/Vma7
VKILAIGTTDDVRGFALAGVETVRCRTAQDAETALITIAADPAVALLLVPAWVGQVARAALTRIRSSRRGPLIVVVPDDSLAR